MKVGNRLVLANGTLITLGSDESFEIEFGNLTFQFVFEPVVGLWNPAGEPNVQVVEKPEQATNPRFVFRLTNFTNPLGTTWFAPVANRQEDPKRQLFLTLTIHTIGQSPTFSRLINYTFSEGES